MRHCLSGGFGSGIILSFRLRLRGGEDGFFRNENKLIPLPPPPPPSSSSDSSAFKSIAIVRKDMVCTTTIFYSWQHQIGCSKRPARELILEGSCNPTTTWRYIRYLIETKYFAKSLDYVICVSPADLRDNTVLRTGTRLILKRLPGKTLQREIYVPPEVRGQFNASMTEEEKLAQIVMRPSAASASQHPSITAQQQTKIIAVPVTYICNFCMERGLHHVRQCPRREKGLPSRKLPTGFPLSLLREAQTDEERERAYLTTQGKYVVQRNLM